LKLFKEKKLEKKKKVDYFFFEKKMSDSPPRSTGSNIMTQEEEEELEALARQRYAQRRPAFYISNNGNSGISGPQSKMKQKNTKEDLNSASNEIVVRQSSRLVVGYADTMGKRPSMEDDMVIVGNLRDRDDEDFVAVFDGHGGFQCAEFAQKRLVEVAAGLMKESDSNSLDVPKIKEILNQSFAKVEREYIDYIRNAFLLGFGDVSKVGACALMTMVYKDQIFVANAGDCRIVLCQQPNPNSSTLNAIPLSFDHNAREPFEQSRLSSLFPNEPDIIVCKRPGSCYVKGRLQPTRSLGDAYLKYPEFNGPPSYLFAKDRARGRHIPSPYNPPYISAVPEIVTCCLQPEDKFVILGSDGVWDYLTNDDAVKIVWEAIQRNEFKEAPRKIIEEILIRAAKSNNMTVEAIRATPQGSERRRIHDDITVMVLMLNEPPQSNRLHLDVMDPLTSEISVIE